MYTTGLQPRINGSNVNGAEANKPHRQDEILHSRIYQEFGGTCLQFRFGKKHSMLKVSILKANKEPHGNSVCHSSPLGLKQSRLHKSGYSQFLQDTTQKELQ